MSMLVSSLMFVMLLAVSLAHLVWAVGRTWPIRTETLLVQTVAGFAGATRMPPRLLTFGVAIALLAAGIVALALADKTSGEWPLTLLGGLLAALFFARGVAGYTPAWQRLTPQEPFRTLDRKNYSPLCLALGAGFIALVIMRLL